MNTKFLFKLCALALACIMLLPCFIACNPERTPEETTPEGDGTTEAPGTTPEPDVTDAPVVNTYEPESYLLEQSLDLVKLTGRYTLPGEGVALNWSGSGIEFNADCEGDVILRIKVSGQSIYAVYVDGEKVGTKNFSGTKNYTVAEGLSRGVHNIRLVKLTDAESVETIVRITVNGLLEEKPADKKYFIEVIGDSITCGYGLGEGLTNDASQSWAYLLAQKLDCDYSLVSIGGIGVAASTDRHNGKEMGDLYPYTHKGSTEVYKSPRQADVVFIGLNTNDNGRTSQFTKDEYVAKATEIINTAKAIHGDDVKIVWVATMMYGTGTCDQYAFELMTKLGGEKSGYYFTFTTPNAAGHNSHPTAAGQQVNADKVYKMVNSKKLLP